VHNISTKQNKIISYIHQKIKRHARAITLIKVLPHQLPAKNVEKIDTRTWTNRSCNPRKIIEERSCLLEKYDWRAS
jgi:hypothetical protein